jgi:hypothetical protein
MDDIERQEALGREQRRNRRLWACSALGAVGLVVMVGSAALFQSWPEHPGLGAVIGAAGFIAGIAMVAVSFALAGRYVSNGDTLRLQASGYRDRVQRDRARTLAFLPITGIYLTYMSVISAWAIATGAGEGQDWLMVVLGPLVSGAWLLMVAGLDNPGDKKMKRLLEDELTLSFRAKALNTGLAVASLGLIVVFGLGLWRPAAGIAAIPALLFITSSVAGLRYYLLDREAEVG